MKNLKLVIAIFLALSSLSQALDWSTLAKIAIQDRGRLKPLDTMATESVQFITGSRSWQKMSSTETLFVWLTEFEEGWNDQQFIRIDYGPLKKDAKLEAERKYFSPGELQTNEDLARIARSAMSKQQRKEKLSEVEKKALNVQNQLGLVRALADGRALNVLPNPKGIHEEWFPLAALASQEYQTPYSGQELSEVSKRFAMLVRAYKNKDEGAFQSASSDFALYLRSDLSKGNYPSQSELNREYNFNHLRPFRGAWILYLCAFTILLSYLVTKKRPFAYVGGAFVLSGFFLHLYGMIVRCLIAHRPPVTNMYESIIWVSLGTVFFAGLVWLRYRQAIIPTAAVVFSMVALVLGDNLPVIFDPGIHPLEPVLRSNFWLTIHVLTITLSYAAFALSLCMGNVVMGYHVFAPRKIERIQFLNLYMYRAMQIGVVLLAAGTILGGVWADYSWGRFWGWDPKEVWALIALLLYIAVLHGRFAGWLKGFGFTATTVISFLGVLMAWYGVNFVLGVGLHSYGFGSGGIGYVGGYILAQLIFIGIGYIRHAKVRNELGREPAIFPKAI